MSASYETDLEAEMLKVLDVGVAHHLDAFSALAARRGFEFSSEGFHNGIEELRI